MKNTDADVWSAQLPQVPTEEQVSWLRAAGFCAIHVDARGFSDEELPAVTAELEARFGEPVATGFDGDWLLFSLGDPTAMTAAADAFLHQPFLEVDYSTVTPRESALGSSWWWTRAESASLTVTPIDPEHPVTSISGTVAAPACGAVPVTLTLDAGGEQQSVEVMARAKQPAPFTLALDAPTDDAAVLTVEAAGEGCPVGESGERRFAQLLDVSAR